MLPLLAQNAVMHNNDNESIWPVRLIRRHAWQLLSLVQMWPDGTSHAVHVALASGPIRLIASLPSRTPLWTLSLEGGARCLPYN